MPIQKKRLEKIKAFENTDFTDCPPLTEEQMKEFKPSHLRNMANYKPIISLLKKELQVFLDYFRVLSIMENQSFCAPFMCLFWELAVIVKNRGFKGGSRLNLQD